MSDTDTKFTTPFPAQTKQATSIINDHLTKAMSISFSDKILLTITQTDRLAQWIEVPLVGNPVESDPWLAGVGGGDGDELIPAGRFQARTMLGAGTAEREVWAHVLARQVAGMITAKDALEQRTLLLGLGLDRSTTSTERDVFLEIVDLALRVI